MKTLVRFSIETHERRTYACEFCGREFRNFRECECHEEFCKSNQARAIALKGMVGRCFRIDKFEDDKFLDLFRIKRIALRESWIHEDVAVVEYIKITRWHEDKMSVEKGVRSIPLEELRDNGLSSENEIKPERFESIVRGAFESFLTHLN